jgi:uncharacterized protein YdbL (DUF1318 family)
MNGRARRSWAVFGAAMIAYTACVTINVYFPESEIKDLSKVIEDEVRKQAETAPVAPEAAPSAVAGEEKSATGDRSSRAPAAGPLYLVFGVTPAYAGTPPEPEVSNPAIRKIIESRAARLARIDKFKSEGFLGENNNALLEARNLADLADLKARAEINGLIRDENRDRETLYKEIAAAKGVELSQLDRIRETYAATLRADARPGDWIQMPDGSWKQK